MFIWPMTNTDDGVNVNIDVDAVAGANGYEVVLFVAVADGTDADRCCG